MKRLSLLLPLLATTLFGYPIAGISPESSKFSVSLLYTREARNIRGLKIHSNRFLTRLSYGLTYYLEIYPLIGGADLNFPSGNEYVSYYNGSWELAIGGGMKIHYLDWIIPASTPQFLRSYVNLFYFTYESRDTISEGTLRHWKVKYHMREFGLGIYWSYQWKALNFSFGGEYTYINGRVWWEAYTASWARIFKSSSFFNDPSQYPRPIIGLDIIMPFNLVLSIETRAWYNKERTSVSIFITQLGAIK